MVSSLLRTGRRLRLVGAPVALLLLCPCLLGQVTKPTPNRPVGISALKPCERPIGPGVSLGSCSQIGVVIGKLVDFEDNTNAIGSEGPSLGVGNTLLLIKAEQSWPVHLTGNVLIQQAEPGFSPFPEAVKTGDRILVAFVREKPVVGWACGRLRPCGKRPAENLIGIEMFRPAGPPYRAGD
jgi:hypothetical protein